MKHLLFTLLILTLSLVNAVAQCPAGEVEVEIEIHTDQYGYEGYWEVVSIDSTCGQGTILSGGNTNVGCNGAGQQNQTPGGYGNNQVYNSPTTCLTEGNSYYLIYSDDWGDGGFEFYVFVNGYLVEEFTGAGSGPDYFAFEASEPPAYNVTMLHPHVKPYQAQGNIDIEAEVYNAGTQVITELALNYSIDNGATVTQTITGLSIANGQTEHIVHPTPWTVSANGAYDLKIWHTNLNGSNVDADPSDDEVETPINIGPGIPNVIDTYLLTLPVITEIASSSEQINLPTDLDFHPVLTKKELWVLNKDSENTGSSTVTISNAGESNQSEEWRRDGNAWHFMSLSTGIAFGDNSNFGTSPGVYDANHNGGQAFTGPALWSSDPAVYAQPSGGNGSHLDMLHASPECQGIAWEEENTYWVFDGYNNDIVRYAFHDDHGPGNDDHSDGEILRFSEVSVSRDAEEIVASHLVYDHSTDWLYVVDHGNQRVFRMDTKSGSLGGTPSYGPFEPLAQYQHVTNYNWEIVADSGLIEPAGIDIIEDRLIVSDYATGEIIIYDISQTPAQELKRLSTNAEGIMGVKIGPEGKIWYVDFDAKTVNRVDWAPDSTIGIADVSNKLDIVLYPNPSNGNLTISNGSTTTVSYTLVNSLGEAVQLGVINPGLHRWNLDLPKGMYYLRMSDNTSVTTTSIILH